MKKKVIVIAVLATQTLLVFALSFVTVVVWRGGVAPDSRLTRLPVLGPLLVAEEAKPVQKEAPDPTFSAVPPVYGPALFLQLGAEGRVERLGRKLEQSKLEQERKLSELRLRRRELDSWSDQIEKEREALREKFESKAEQIGRREDELERRSEELNRQEHRIKAAERSNLEKTAQIYERMDPERAGAILAEIYREGDKDTAVKIIALMRDRNAAQTIAAMPGEHIGADITGMLKYVTTEEK